MAGSQEALDRFEQQTAWPMLLLSLAIIPLLVIPLVVDLTPGAEQMLLGVDWIIWALFVLEYGIRLYLAPRKGAFVRSNVIDLLVVVVPFLRPVRVIRSARALRLLRAAKGTVFLLRAMKAGRNVLRSKRFSYTLLVVVVVTFASAFLVLEFERASPEANIESFPDALWWALTTITTVGYGDQFPTSAAGRGVGVILMFVGVGIFGIVAASFASFFIGRELEEESAESDPHLAAISERLERIEHLLVARNESEIGPRHK